MAQSEAPGIPPVGSSPDALERMLNSPALAAPPGADTTMTTDGPDQVWYLVVAIVCIAVPGLFLMLRVYTKLAIARAFELADYFIFVAFPLMVVEVVNGYFMIKWGAGVHQWQVTNRQLFNQFYWMNTAEIIYCPLSFLVKMAILLQYLRLFAPSRQLNRLMWYGSWLTMIACFIFYAVFMFWTMFYCKPRQMIWYKFTPGGECHDHGPIVISQGAFNMASDIVILLLPTRSLWQLDVPFWRKVIITMLFATGLLACAASVMRIIFTLEIAPVFTMSDVSHNGLFIGLWTEAEVALGFIVACSLSLPKLIQAKRTKLDRAVSYATSPFSTFRSTVRTRSSSRSTAKTDTVTSSTYNNSIHRSTRTFSQSPPMRDGMPDNSKRPLYYEERELQAQYERGMYPIREERDPYALPSVSGSSNYSRSTGSVRTSRTSVDSLPSVDSLRVAPLNVAPRRASDASAIREATRNELRMSGTWTMPDDDDTMPVLSEADAKVFRKSRRLTQEELFKLHSFDFEHSGSRPFHEIGDFTLTVPEIPPKSPRRITQDEMFKLKQFNFTRNGTSIDIERSADAALRKNWI